MEKKTIRETLLFCDTARGDHVRVWFHYGPFVQANMTAVKQAASIICDPNMTLRDVADHLAKFSGVNAVEARPNGLDEETAELTYNDWP
jgi:hypothetical protein